MKVRKEAILDVRMQAYRDAYHKYRQEHCKEDGQQATNLSRIQMEGLKSLKKEVKDGLILVSCHGIF